MKFFKNSLSLIDPLSEIKRISCVDSIKQGRFKSNTLLTGRKLMIKIACTLTDTPPRMRPSEITVHGERIKLFDVANFLMHAIKI
jgi:hypothetical protein